MARDYRQIEFRHVCAIARAVFLRQPQMTDAEWKAAVLDGCAKQGWDNPSSDMLARALGAVERSLLETGIRRHVADAPAAKPEPHQPDRCWTPADYRLLADTLKRIAARSAGANALPSNVSPMVAVERLDISEPAALDQFYAEAAGGDRIGAIRRFAEIAIVRPADWDYAGERSAAPRGISVPQCYGCRVQAGPYHRHHIIQIQHGGSNYIRNIVGLCEACHADVHPWLPKANRARAHGWSSITDLAPTVLAMAAFAGLERKKDAS